MNLRTIEQRIAKLEERVTLRVESDPANRELMRDLLAAVRAYRELLEVIDADPSREAELAEELAAKRAAFDAALTAYHEVGGRLL